MQPTSIFLVCPPGLEPALRDEARALGWHDAASVAGGVEIAGGWPDVWRANRWLRCATRVLVRVASFRAAHLAQLDKRARRLDWAALLRPDVAIRVEATCRRSRIYHDRAAAERIARAASEGAGCPVDPEAALVLKARIVDDLVTVSLDASGEALHLRGLKGSVGKAPLRETMAAAFLRQMGFDGTQSVLDPMCGSGTFPIEAAEIAAGLAPGRARSFADESLASFDPAAVTRMPTPPLPAFRVFGRDRDQGAVAGAIANAERAGVAAMCDFARGAISDLERPGGPPGLVLVNPPYGARIGNRKLLFALYGSLGGVLRDRFGGWRVGLVTSDPGLAKATGLTWSDIGPSVPHGGLKVRLHATAPL